MAQWVKGTVIQSRQWASGLPSLQFEADIAPFKAGQFVQLAMDVDGERVIRPYSFVNAPHERPLEIYFNVVNEGPLTPRFADLRPGDWFWVRKNAGGLMTLDQIPAVPHLWLLATGTGVGPFLSILKSDEPWRRFERIVLVHAVRTRDDLTYRDTLEQLQAAHPEQLALVPFVSRERVPDTLHGRIPASLDEGGLEARAGLDLDPDRAHVMLCGNSGMINDAIRVLEGRGLKRHRRRDPGHITTEKYH